LHNSFELTHSLKKGRTHHWLVICTSFMIPVVERFWSPSLDCPTKTYIVFLRIKPKRPTIHSIKKCQKLQCYSAMGKCNFFEIKPNKRVLVYYRNVRIFFNPFVNIDCKIIAFKVRKKDFWTLHDRIRKLQLLLKCFWIYTPHLVNFFYHCLL